MLSYQELQDRDGHVIMGWSGPTVAIGHVFAAFRDDHNDSEILDCPITVVGFGTVAEWKEQAGTDLRCDWDFATRVRQILKVRAE